jgi:hypothetical protein
MLRRVVSSALLLSAIAVFHPAPLLSQASPPESGAYGLSFRFPTSTSSQLGIRKMLGSGANAGLNMGLSFTRAVHERAGSDDEVSTHWSAGLFPNVRFYRGGRANVLPFLVLDAGISYTDEADDASRLALSAGGGLGVEWFPVASMSLSGTTGISLQYDRTKNDTPETHAHTRLSSITSSLSVNLYF